MDIPILNLPMIEFENKRWYIMGKGIERDGKTFLHLASFDEGYWQKNGFYRNQLCDFVDNDLIKKAQLH